MAEHQVQPQEVCQSWVFYQRDSQYHSGLGQDQDSYGGGFEAAQSFVGSMTDVYMWDSVLSPKEIQYYMTGIIVRPGNVVDWRQMVFTVTGAVVEETSVLGFVYHCN